MQTPWAVILCKFTDGNDEPFPMQYYNLPEGFRTWIPPIHHFGIPLAKPGGRKKPFRNLRNRRLWILLQDKSNSVVAVSYDKTPALHFTNLNGRCIGIFFGIKSARQRAYELRSMPIHEVSQLHVFIEFHYYRLPFHAVLQIPVRLAPSVFVDDIDQRDTADWPEPAHRVADRQQSIGVDIGWQAECGLSFLLELQIKRRQSRAEAERSRRQQHVLRCWVDRRARRAGRGAAIKARDNPDRGLMNVRGQILCRVEQPQKSFPAHARGRFTSSVAWGNLLVPRTLVQGPDSLLDLRVADYQEPPALHVAAARRTHACLQDLANQFVRHRVRF